MKSFNQSFAAFAGIFLALLISTSNAYSEKLNKVISKEFNAEKGTTVKIENRFGQVTIENSDVETVSINVEVTVEHPSKDRAEKMLSAITITIDQQGAVISAITEIDENLFKSTSGFSFNSSSKEFSINYNVKMPKHLNLDLSNKFGDIFIDEVTGQSRIELKYGNLKANRIFYGSEEPLNMLTLGYGNATIEEVNWMRFEIKYSNLDITNSKAIVLQSKYSKINIENVSSLVVESKYDDIRVGSISNLVGESGYTNYKVNTIGKKLDITTRYGDVKIFEVNENFESIRFNGSYASLNAPIDSKISYKINGEAAYGGISYTEPARVSRIEGNTKVSVNGTVGNNESTNASVDVKVKYGSANLK